MDRWRENPKLLAKRVAVLDEVREQLTGVQPARQRLRARKRVEPSVGEVVQIDLLDGRFAYGRVFRDAGLSVLSTITTSPALPPFGSRDYLFTVNVLEEVFRACTVIGVDPAVGEDYDWPPQKRIGSEADDDFRIYYRGSSNAPPISIGPGVWSRACCGTWRGSSKGSGPRLLTERAGR